MSKGIPAYGPVIRGIHAAYKEATDRLWALSPFDFARACSAMDWGDLPPETKLHEAMTVLAEQGSIDAAAVLNVLALKGGGLPEAEKRASASLIAVIMRNPAARDELATEGLVILLEEAAREMGMVEVEDPVTGEMKWKRP